MNTSALSLAVATCVRCFLALLITFGVLAHAQNAASPAKGAEPALAEMEKWLATTDAQWQAALKRDVTDVHAAALGNVKLQYLAAIDAAITKASSAGDLDGAVTLRNEQKRFGDTNVFPEQDEATDPDAVKQIRAAIRVQLARLNKDNAVRTKALHAKYDAALAQAQTQLTQHQRLDDALLVKAKRTEVAAAWLTPAVNTAPGSADPAKPSGTAAAAPGKPKPAFKPLGTQMTRRVLVKATVDAGDNVVVQDSKLHIEHSDWSKPLGISVNGIKWEPSW
ncbi:MAG: hypothetical protein ABIP20_02225, partial [Chthoniobacteraceae bacterium]